MKAAPARPFTAAVLAGGQSSRLGTDKAFLPWAGRRLLDRQLDLLRALGPAELLLSGRPGVDYQAADVSVVYDAEPGQGPLGGLAAVLAAVATPHVLLLGVDLPAMTPDFLHRLLLQRAAGAGVVPRSAAGWEPLAAVYPRAILPLVQRHLGDKRLALHQLIDAGVAAGLLVEARMPGDSAGVFRNVNTPEDLSP
jgi:molybdenum cofactor guanylyltransferase